MRMGSGLGYGKIRCTEGDCYPMGGRNSATRGLELAVGLPFAEDFVAALDYGALWSFGKEEFINSQLVGASLTARVRPVSAWLSVGCIVEWVSTQSWDGSTGASETDRALGLKMTLGRDWWVAQGFALGVSAQYVRGWTSWVTEDSSDSVHHSGLVMLHAVLLPGGTLP